MPNRRPLFLTNTLGHQLEEFSPIDEHCVRMYTCGPTVYSYAHIGNFRSFIMADVLRRVLEYNGYRVEHARNITDVGHLTNEELETGVDRMEKAAQQEHRNVWDIAQHYTDAFLADADRLNLLPPTYVPRATEYIESMVALASRLEAGGHAYAADGDLYFDVTSFAPYGKLSGNQVEDLLGGSRKLRGRAGTHKRSPADFALWRGQGPDKAMRWPSPWGEGVPGWHLECSAMAFDLLGEQIDIHTGGIDNMFPHHEDEIAQSEAATGKPFVRYWLHSQWLQLGEKMSKSLGNVYTVSDLAAMGIHPLSYRYFTFQAHYRTPLQFSPEALRAAQTTLVRLWETAAELTQSGPAEPLDDAAASYQERFHVAVNRDMSMSDALAVLHDAAGAKLPAAQKLALLTDFDRVLGLELVSMGRTLSELSPEQENLLATRNAARAARDWALSDGLRAALAEDGIDVKDTAGGQRWLRKTGYLPTATRQSESTADHHAEGEAQQAAETRA